jgi:hypothetical protein
MNCTNCSRVNHISNIKDNRCYFCNHKLSFPSLAQRVPASRSSDGNYYLNPNTSMGNPIIAPQRSTINPSTYDNMRTLNRDMSRSKINDDQFNRPSSSPLLPTKSSSRPVDKFIRAGNDILLNGPKKEIEILKGNPIANAQQIEKNRGNISVNKNQQAFLTLKDKNFIETEYGSSTDVFGNYAPDEDEYETTTVDKNYNYKKSADELMKERGDY